MTGETIGSVLRRERHKQRVSLKEIACLTRLSLGCLRRIEAGRFDELPGEVFVRGFVRSYADCLNLNIDWMLNRYFDLRNQSSLAIPLGLSSIETRSNRVGLFLALIVLFMLCALSLSVIWAPRSRTRLIHLSQVTSCTPRMPSFCVRSTTVSPTQLLRS